ncbi:MAG: aldehyde dehydrogenase [Lachnospiraceae bacterium]|nr:aldehyde dehydrogenase [Lachnospiraceae bacterium]
MDITEIVKAQRKFFESGKTLSVAFRKEALISLEKAIKNHEQEVISALKEDLGKSLQESYMCEYGLALSELTYMKKHFKGYARRKRATSPLTNFPSASYLYKVPYGNVLIMSPWNYPFLLTIDPLIDAIAAGNTAVVKPSAYSPKTGAVMQKIISEAFDPEYVAMILGGRQENQTLLDEKFDFIFFTGSQAVGKEVMSKASKHLTPVSLELGGKSPCIIDEDANIKLAAKRVVFGKYLNCGQTCVAPDYIVCHKNIKNAFIEAVKEEIKKQYGDDPLNNDAYGKIINDKHFNRIVGLIDEKKLVYGGKSDSSKLKIEPTVIDNVSYDDAIMQQEIFGPLMPILSFDNLDELLDNINKGPHPLAFYYFSRNSAKAKAAVARCRFGGGCINDTIVHLATPYMPFGGVGESGMGNYHGKFGFDTFSHTKSIVNKKQWLDLNMRYQPYTDSKVKILKMFLK